MKGSMREKCVSGRLRRDGCFPLRTMASLMGLLFATGCVNVRVARPDHWHPEVGGTNITYQAANDAYTVPWAATTKQTTNICAFTGWKQLTIDPGDCADDGMSEIVIHRSFGDVLAEMVTLGFCQRMTIEWRCAKPPQTTKKDF